MIEKNAQEDHMENNNKLGRSIQLLRESNMMTREDFAQRIGVLRKTVVDWEEGKAIPSAEQILAIAEFAGVDPRSMVEDPAQIDDTAAAPSPAAGGGKRILVSVGCLALALCCVMGAMTLIQTLPGKAGADAVTMTPDASSGEEQPAALPESLALVELETALWDLDGDGEKELVVLEEDVLFVQGDTAYGLAAPLAKGQSLTAQDGVFIVKNEAGESRIYSRLRDGAVYPAG